MVLFELLPNAGLFGSGSGGSTPGPAYSRYGGNDRKADAESGRDRTR